MGACCEKQAPLHPATDTSFQDNLVREQKNEFSDIYEIVGEPLGQGGISTIYKIKKRDSALGGSSQSDFVKRRKRRRGKRNPRVVDTELTTSLRGPEHYYALKVIDVSKINGERAMKFMRNELGVLKSLDHPGIVRAYETFELDKRLAIVMELSRGGDLADRYPYTEQQVAIMIRQVVSAVSYMHKRQYVHRDIKLENLLFQSDDPDNWTVKVIDFGLSKKYAQVLPVRSQAVGTVYSMAPEALEGVFTTKVDLWSIGVVTYLLISGDRPFRGKTPEEMTATILKGDFSFHSQVWDQRSPECKDFISSLLQKDPTLRPDAEASLKHPWFLKYADNPRSSATEEVLESIRERLVSYCSENNGDFKRLALNVMAKQLGSDELQDVRDAFLQIDEGNDGYITMDELKKVLRIGNDAKNYSDEEIESIFSKLDVNCNGVITWTEFVAGTIGGDSAVEEHRLADAFDLIDSQDHGYISKEDLRIILGKHYSQEYVAKLMSEVDIDKDHKISFAEFKRRLFHVTTTQPHSAIEFHDTDTYDLLRWD